MGNGMVGVLMAAAIMSSVVAHAQGYTFKGNRLGMTLHRAKDVAQLSVRMGQPLIEFDGPPQVRFGGIEIARVQREITQPGIGIGAFGVEPNRLGNCGGSLIKPTKPTERISEIDAQPGIFGKARHRRCRSGLRQSGLFEPQQQLNQLPMAVRIGWGQLKSTPPRLLGFFRPTGTAEQMRQPTL